MTNISNMVIDKFIIDKKYMHRKYHNLIIKITKRTSKTIWYNEKYSAKIRLDSNNIEFVDIPYGIITKTISANDIVKD